MLWGSNCADTMPPIMQWVYEQQQRGGKLIVVDPRCTETARTATLHLQLTPGTDLALANGLLYLALEEQLIDRAYIAERTVGFEELERSVRTSTPAFIERLTGVSIARAAASRSPARGGRVQHAAFRVAAPSSSPRARTR